MNDTSTDILILALASGEHLIAEVAENGGAYVATNVLQIVQQIDESNGQIRMGLSVYMPFSTGEFAIPTSMAIVAIPSPDLKDHYSERFGLIITPNNQKIIV